MLSYFVTATGTDIGKTYITSNVIRAARQVGLDFSAIKPVLSGYDEATASSSDSARLLAAMGKKVTLRNIAAITPWRFAAPLSPDMAAAREARQIDFPTLISFCEAASEAAPDVLLIEGVGGVAVPLDDTHLVVDLISALRLPAILVAGTYLGTLSHTITAVESLVVRGIPVAAIVLNESLGAPVSLEETAAALARRLPHPIHQISRNAAAPPFRALVASLSELEEGAETGG
jgi:dethiobiotin synthetase